MLLLETTSGPPMLPDSKKLDNQEKTDGMKISFGHKICDRYEDIGIYMQRKHICASLPNILMDHTSQGHFRSILTFFNV